ncbi:histidine kinase [Streptomyces sp. NRRL B-1568]|nr:histidine kinase [Streptomyces sp. NRRL B-1568]
MTGARGRRALTRWTHLLLGGALLMPYYLLANVLVSFFVPTGNVFALPTVTWQIATTLMALVPAAITALSPVTRPLEVTAARALCDIPGAELASGPAESWAARGRAAAWYTLHLGVGGVVSGISLAAPPAALMLLILPLIRSSERLKEAGWVQFFAGSRLLLAPFCGLALFGLVAAVSWAAGALLARCAPVLLGPTAADRLAAAEQHAMRLALRNRLARELHDSVGHALSAVTLQAGAARRVLDSDPAFARQALLAIEETTRDAVGELDTVLGLLREDGTASTAPAPTLCDLDALLARTRAAGGTVTLTTGTALDRIPPVVSREAYRIVQEGLGNALRHAGRVPVQLDIAVRQEDLEVTVENPLGTEPPAVAGPARRTGGGHGLRGIAERARLLRGDSDWGERDGVWRLSVRLPLGGGAR